MVSVAGLAPPEPNPTTTRNGTPQNGAAPRGRLGAARPGSKLVRGGRPRAGTAGCGLGRPRVAVLPPRRLGGRPGAFGGSRPALVARARDRESSCGSHRAGTSLPAPQERKSRVFVPAAKVPPPAGRPPPARHPPVECPSPQRRPLTAVRHRVVRHAGGPMPRLGVIAAPPLGVFFLAGATSGRLLGGGTTWPNGEVPAQRSDRPLGRRPTHHRTRFARISPAITVGRRVPSLAGTSHPSCSRSRAAPVT